MPIARKKISCPFTVAHSKFLSAICCKPSFGFRDSRQFPNARSMTQSSASPHEVSGMVENNDFSFLPRWVRLGRVLSGNREKRLHSIGSRVNFVLLWFAWCVPDASMTFRDCEIRPRDRNVHHRWSGSCYVWLRRRLRLSKPEKRSLPLLSQHFRWLSSTALIDQTSVTCTSAISPFFTNIAGITWGASQNVCVLLCAMFTFRFLCR